MSIVRRSAGGPTGKSGEDRAGFSQFAARESEFTFYGRSKNLTPLWPMATMSGMEFLVVIVFIGLFIAIFVFAQMQAAQRRQDVAAAAAQRGWRFRPENDRTIEARFPEFSCLREGSNRYGYNIVEGTRGQWPVCGFDYHYETHSTDSNGHSETTTHSFSAVVVDTGLPLSPLMIRPETFLDRFGAAIGFHAIEFESAEFNRQFHVKAPDKHWAFDVIHQGTMEFLLAAPRFTIELAGPRVMAHRSGTFNPGEFEQGVDVIGGIIDRLPDYLIRQWKGAAS